MTAIDAPFSSRVTKLRRDVARETRSLRHSAETTRLATSVEHEQNVCRNVPDAAELLRNAVFEHEDVVELECRDRNVRKRRGRRPAAGLLQ